MKPVTKCFHSLFNTFQTEVNNIEDFDLTERVNNLTSGLSTIKLFEISHWFGEII